jgi:hypothetical protein
MWQILQVVDLVCAVLLMALGGFLLWRPRGWLMWPRSLRDDPRTLRWRGVFPLIFGTFIATLELLIVTGNERAIDYVVFPATGLVAIVALAIMWTRGRTPRSG